MSKPLLLICPHCQTQNRVPEARLTEQPKCGKCRGALFAGEPVDLNAETFDRHLHKSDIPLLVDFWASWCGPCKVMAPHFQKAAETLEPKVRLGKVDTETEQQLAARYNIRSIPTLKLFYRGKELGTQAGAMDANRIVNWVVDLL